MSKSSTPAFYNFAPSDWSDEHFDVECRFREAPSDALLGRLATAAARFQFGDVHATFSGPFALISITPLRGRMRQALSGLAELLIEQANDTLLEAIVLNAWQQDQPLPTLAPGPALPNSTRPVNSELPPLAPHPVFDSAVDAVAEEAWTARIREIERAAAEQPIALEPIEHPAPPAPPALPEALATPKFLGYIGGDCWLVKRPDLHGWVLPVDNWPEGMRLATGAVTVRGERAVVSANTSPPRVTKSRRCTELLLVEGQEVRHFFSAPDSDDGVSVLTWLDDDHVVVTTSKRTVVVRVADGGERASIQGGTRTVVGCRGRLLANDTPKGVRLLRLAGDTLEPLASYPGLHLADRWGAQQPYQRLVNDLPVLGIGQLAWIPMGTEDA